MRTVGRRAPVKSAMTRIVAIQHPPAPPGPGSMQHAAREGGCRVIGWGLAVKAGDLPATFPERSRLFD